MSYIEILEQVDVLLISSDFGVIQDTKQKIARFRDEAMANKEEILSRECQIEIDALNFVTRNNSISFTVAGTDEDGNRIEYPDINSFNLTDFDYLDKRLKETNNIYLKSRYSHILWHSPRKHKKYGIICTESHWRIAELFYPVIKFENKISSSICLISAIENALLVGEQSKSAEQFKDALIFFKKIIRDFSENIFEKIGIALIEFALTNRKFLKRDDYIGLEHEIYKVANNSGDHRRIDILKLGKKVDKKLGGNNLYWDKGIAEVYEKMSYDREDETNLISVIFAQDAVSYYKKAKETAKAKELSKRYEMLKSKMKFGTVSTSVNIGDSIKFIRSYSENLTNESCDQILTSLMYDPDITIDFSVLDSQVRQHEIDNPLMFMLSKNIIDSSGHIAEHFETYDERFYHAMIEHLDFHIETFLVLLLNEIFRKSIIKNKINISSFSNFLRKNSWIGQDIRKTKGGNTNIYNWTSMISPSINDYLIQLNNCYVNGNKFVNLVLCIDSLALKVEGILRDMVSILGGESFYFTTDQSNRNITREKDINALLHEDIIKKTISNTDLLILKYILIEKAGLNLRNNVAHCLFRNFDNYSLNKMNLLIFAILILAKNEYDPMRQ